MQTFIHIFEKCNQDWFAVSSILECLVLQLVKISPDLKEIFLKSDNAGCYHNASLLINASAITARGGLTLRNYSFSEAHSGKDVCDRKIAPLKAHVTRYLNEGTVTIVQYQPAIAALCACCFLGCIVVHSHCDEVRASVRLVTLARVY